MARRVHCPHEGHEDAWIDLPDKYFGRHAIRRDEVVSKLPDGTLATQANFAVAIALLDDWNLPGMNGNPEQWDFAQMPLELIGWINNTTLNDFNDCFIVKKNPERGS